MTSPSFADPLPKKPASFDPPQEPQWHRMIAEAAYFLAQGRGFLGQHCIDDWLQAEQQVKQMISPDPDSEVTMNAKDAKPSDRQNPPPQSEASRFENYATTQAAGDGIEGDPRKPAKTAAEKISANMPDRK